MWTLLWLACQPPAPPIVPPPADTGPAPDTRPAADSGSIEDTGDAPVRTDADGDGFEEGYDCDDADPQVHPGADEVCDSGADEDCDGRIDCEDGECTAACAEDCADGVDNNDDGLVDCEDEQCLWVPACSDIEIRVRGGHLTMEVYAGSMSWFDHSHLTIDRVSGTVSTYAADAGGWRSCSWSWGGHAEEQRGGTWLTHFAIFPGERPDFAIAGSCELTDDGFLPRYFQGGLMRRGDPWQVSMMSGGHADWYQPTSSAWRTVTGYAWFFGEAELAPMTLSARPYAP